VTRAALVSTPLLAVLAWSAALVADPDGWDDGAALLIGFGLLASTAIALPGMLLSGGRWARRTSFVAMTGCLVVAAARPIDPFWVAAVGLTAIALASLLSSPVIGLTRKLPSASGPPERAVLFTMSLVLVPLVVGLASRGGSNTATLIVGLTAPLAGLWYSRVLPGGFYVARYVWPGAALALALLQPWPGGIASAALGAAVFIVGLDPSVKVAFYPPTETGSTYSIPPELTPREVLDAADIDERGRRR
jgi:hypothetical protein